MEHAVTTPLLLDVGFVGLGDQGLPMAIAIAEAGFPLHVWARRPASLEALQDTPHTGHEEIDALAAASDVVCLCVSTDDDVAALLKDSLLPHLRAGSVVVNHGTGTPSAATRFGELCEGAGVDFLDAPVSGGRLGAQNRTLTTVVGGPATVAERCRPIFEAFSAHVVRLGGHGAGELAKLLNNALMMMNHANVGDILELATHLGVDPVALVEILRTGSGSSTALELMATGSSGIPEETLTHLHDVLVLDMGLFTEAMHDAGADADAITARGLAGANRVREIVRTLNP
jgi:3-hydroxyisobutyrate dehydrogenase-like beta-hydroxyacid dehydrogenase